MQADSSSPWQILWTWIRWHHAKIIAVVLGLQATYALYNSVEFLFFRLPELELLLDVHLITQARINRLANRAIIDALSTFISLFFALHLSTIQKPFVQRLGKILAVLIVIANTQLELILDQFGTSQLITTTFVQALRSLLNLGSSL